MKLQSLWLEIENLQSEEAAEIVNRVSDILISVNETREKLSTEKDIPILAHMQFAYGEPEEDDGPIEPVREENAFTRYMKSAKN